MTILVTGGSGFIGSAVVRHLVLDRGETVVNLDRLTYAGNAGSTGAVADHPNYAFERADITDRAAVDRLFATWKPGAILHLAAESHVDRSIDRPGDFIQTNIVGTWTLLEAARSYLASHSTDDFRFVHISTDEVFGDLGPDGMFTEDSSYRPTSPYSASKASSDHLVRAWHHTYGLPAIVTNCSNNYGPYQFPEKLIPVIILNALQGNPIPVYGTGSNVRDWLHVEDHARALALVLDRGVPGETYAIGGNNERSNIDLVRSICGILDDIVPDPSHAPHADLIAFVADRPGHDLRYAIDAGKIERDLGWQPRHTLDTGLRETVQWYVDHTDWCASMLDGSLAPARQGVLR